MYQVYFGSSMESKLHEDYVFDLYYIFQVALLKVEAFSDDIVLSETAVTTRKYHMMKVM